MVQGFVYILQSRKSGQYYIGSTMDTQKRLHEHNSGTTISTRNKGPWTIVFQQQYPSIPQARKIEQLLKKMKRRDYLEKIIRDQVIKMN